MTYNKGGRVAFYGAWKLFIFAKEEYTLQFFISNISWSGITQKPNSVSGYKFNEYGFKNTTTYKNNTISELEQYTATCRHSYILKSSELILKTVSYTGSILRRRKLVF
jgi:hypothetical protein